MKLTRSLLVLAGLAALAAAPATQPSTKPAVKPYTLDTCIVSGEKLGEMGKPIVLVHEGREIKFCCKSCVSEFKENPAKFIKKLDEADKKAAETKK